MQRSTKEPASIRSFGLGRLYVRPLAQEWRMCALSRAVAVVVNQRTPLSTLRVSHSRSRSTRDGVFRRWRLVHRSLQPYHSSRQNTGRYLSRTFHEFANTNKHIPGKIDPIQDFKTDLGLNFQVHWVYVKPGFPAQALFGTSNG